MKQAIVSLAVIHSLLLIPACDSAPASDAAKTTADKPADKPADRAVNADSKDATVTAPGTEVRPVAEVKPVAGDAGKSATSPAATAKRETTVKAGAVDSAGPRPVADRTGSAPAEPVKPAGPDAGAAAPAGEGMAQKEGWANYAKELKRKTDAVNTACGGSISGSYDKSTYTDFDPIKDRTQSACQQAVGTLSAICSTDAGKESVRKLTRATCKFSTSGTGASLAGTTLVIKIDPVKSSITGKAAGSYSWASAIKEVL